MLKVCNQCKVGKPLLEYQRDKAKKDGRRQPCRQCLRARRNKKRTQDTKPLPKAAEKAKESRLEEIMKRSESHLHYHKFIKKFSLKTAKPHIHVEDSTIDGLLEKAIETLEKKDI